MDSCNRTKWILLFFLIISALFSTHVVADDGDEPIAYESFPHLIPEINDFTGAARQQIPITVPPGRNGMQPELSFVYNSYKHNGQLGKGWELEIGAIQRQTKWGAHYDRDEFVVISKGRKFELVPVGNDRFQPRIETEFARYIFHRGQDSWEVIQKDGTKLYFGSESDSNARQTTAFGTFSWGLDRVEDTNGNHMTVDYVQDHGQRYPVQIDYAGNTKSGDAPSNKVVFSYDGTPRPDVPNSYVSKTLIKTALRLESVKTFGKDDLPSLEYDLVYETSPIGQLSLLKNIRILGSDGQTELPPYVFSYQHGAYRQLVEGPRTESIDLARQKRHFADVNGDNRDDLILTSSDHSTTIQVYPSEINGGFGPPITSTIDFVPGTAFTAGYDADLHFFVDLNGDRLADYVYATHRYDIGETKEFVLNRVMAFINTGDGTFVAGGSFDIPLHILNNVGTFDYNNDGFVDVFVEELKGGGRTIYLSDGQGGFLSPNSIELPDRSGGTLSKRYFADINGDGLTDIINYYYRFSNTAVFGLKQREFKTYLSDGNGGFELVGEQSFMFLFPDSGSIYEHNLWGKIVSVVFKDVNNDSMADMIVRAKGQNYAPSSPNDDEELQYYLSDGNGQYTLDRKIDISHFTINVHGAAHHLTDLNADGWLDIVRTVYYEEIGDSTSPEHIDNYIETYLSIDAAPFDLMDKAVSPSGAKMTFKYRRSSETPGHCRLPFILHSVKELSVDDGVRAQPSTSRYLHQKGYYDAIEREYRGFEVSTQVHPDTTITKRHHYVGNAACTGFTEDSYYLAGRVRQVDKYASDGVTLLSKTNYTWDTVEDPNHPWAFVKLSQEHTEHYDDQTVFSRKYYSYDDTNGNLERITSVGTGTVDSGANDVVTQYGYHNYSGDDWNPLWRRTLEMTYDLNPPVQPAVPDRHVEFIYDEVTGNLRQKIEVNHDPDVDNSVWAYEYYPNGNLQYEYDAKGNPPTDYQEYDDTQTYPTRILNPKGHPTVKTWDPRYGKELTITDPNQQTTAYFYDKFGRLVRIDYPDLGQMITTFSDYCTDADCNNVGLPRRVEVGIKNTDTTFENTVYYFDGLSRKVQVVKTGEGSNFSVAKTHYDDMGRVDFQAGPFFQNSTAFLTWNGYNQDGYTTSLGSAYPYTYTDFDNRGRPEFVYTWDGQNGRTVTSSTYSGFEVTITDPDNCAKTEIRDHLDRIIEVIDHPDSGDIHTRYVYNAANDLLEVRNHFWTTTNHDQNRIEMRYDSLGRKIFMDDPDMGQWNYQYDPNGNMTLQTDARGLSTRFGYDLLNRIELKDYLDSDEPSVTYQYDDPTVINGVGRLYRMSNSDVTTVYKAYDAMGRETEVSKAITGATTRTSLWEYDYSGKVKRLTYPHTDASPIFHVDYDFHPGTSLVHTATGSDGTVFATVTGYQPNTKIGRIDFGNGVYTDYEYDGWSERLNAITTIAADGPGTPAQDRRYSYTPAGDIEVIDDLARVENYIYSYDKMHRLKSETTSTGSVGVIPAVMDLQYNDPNHINAVSSVTHKGVSHSYWYDENGNQESGPDLTDPMAVVPRNLTFNADNMPTTVEHPTGGTISLTYDGESQRAKKTGAGKDTYYYSNEFEIIDNIDTFYIFAGNLRVAMVKDNTPTYFHKDHLGSSTAMTNAQGNIIETAMYMPFGGKRGDTGISVSGYKFTDQELDAESGLYNYDARLYDPIVGRFISPDAIIPNAFYSQSHNRYSYCLNHPLKYNDPSGHEEAEHGQSDEEDDEEVPSDDEDSQDNVNNNEDEVPGKDPKDPEEKAKEIDEKAKKATANQKKSSEKIAKSVPKVIEKAAKKAWLISKAQQILALFTSKSSDGKADNLTSKEGLELISKMGAVVENGNPNGTIGTIGKSFVDNIDERVSQINEIIDSSGI